MQVRLNTGRNLRTNRPDFDFIRMFNFGDKNTVLGLEWEEPKVMRHQGEDLIYGCPQPLGEYLR